jgi:hypothetical protein
MTMMAGMFPLSGLTACWRWPRPFGGCGRAAASPSGTVPSARRNCRAPVAGVRLSPVPEWEALPEASRAAAGCLAAVLVMRMIRAGHGVPGEDGHDEREGGAAVGGREQDPGAAPGQARGCLRAPVHARSGRPARGIDAAAVRAGHPGGGPGVGAVPDPGDRRGPGALGVRCRGPAGVPAACVGGGPRPRRHRAGDRDVEAGRDASGTSCWSCARCRGRCWATWTRSTTRPRTTTGCCWA